jgi:hypothetical protein
VETLATASFFAGASDAAGAQTFATLHVRKFTMSVDRSTVGLGEPFHLTIATHVDEPVVQIDNLTLPDLSGFDSLGDERRCVASAAGSDCIETVTLAATIAGSRTIAGATLEAIDARNGKPSRFTSDSVTIVVTGATADDLGGLVAGFLFGALRGAIVTGLIVVAVLALLWGFAARRKSVARPRDVAPSAVEPAAAPDPDAPFRELVAAFEREPTRANALRVRHLLRENIGARPAETFGDLAARRAADPGVLAALGAVERAAFCEDARVADAAREALPFLTR